MLNIMAEMGLIIQIGPIKSSQTSPPKANTQSNIVQI